MMSRQWFRALGSVAPSIMFAVVASIFLVAAVPVQAQGALAAPTTAVGTTSTTLTATVNITASGMLSSISVLTQGATSLDYAVAPGGTCATGTAYTATPAQSCTVMFTFKPTHPWVRYGAISLFDGAGNLLGNTFIVGLGTGPQVSYPLSTATVPSSLSSSLFSPSGIAVDGSGNVYVADTNNNAVKEIMAMDGVIPSSPTIRTLGSGFFHPSGVAVDGSGNVYVADTSNNLIKEMVAVNGVVPTISPTIRTLAPGSTFSGPSGVAVDGSGNVYVADTVKNTVEEIAAVNGVIPANPTVTTLGSGFSLPTGVAVDTAGDVFVADSNHNAVKEILADEGVIPSSPTITTIGSGFSVPTGIAFDPAGDLYVADTGNHAVKVIVAVGGAIPPSPSISALGSGFTAPVGVAADASGNLFIVDSASSTATELNAQTAPSLSFASTPVGGTSTDSPQTITVGNNGNTPLVFSIPATGSNPAASANFSVGAGSTCPQVASNAASTGSLSAGATCTYSLSFTPVQTGTTGTLTLTDTNLNAPGSSQMIPLTGTATLGTLTVTVAPASAPVNSTSVSLSAMVAYAGVPPTGAVTFTVNSGTPIAATCTPTPTPLTCTAMFDATGLTAAPYPIVATVAADTDYNLAMGNGTLNVTQAMPSLVLSTSGTPSIVDGSVTFTVAVSPNAGILPSGNVSITATSGGVSTTICSVAPVAGSVSCSTSALQALTYSVLASIAADTNFTTNTSNTISQVVNPEPATLTLATSGSPSIVNGSVTFTATLSAASVAPVVPGGKVSFTNGGVPISAACTGVTISPALTATCTTSALLAPSAAIGATYGSDPNFTATPAATLTQTVNQAPSSLALISSPSPSTVDQPVIVTATLSSTAGFAPTTPAGTVSFSVNDIPVAACSGANAVTLNASFRAVCTLTSLAAPSDTITATYSADPNFSNSTALPLGQNVARNTPVGNTVSSSLPTAIVNQSVIFTVTINPNGASAAGVVPGGTVTLTKGPGGPVVCGPMQVTGVPANGTATASCTTSFASVFPATAIVAVYSGDMNFNAGNAPSVQQTVQAAPTTTTINPNITQAVVNQTVTFTETVVPTNTGSGYPGTALPQSGTVTFVDSSAPASPICTSTLSGGVLTPPNCAHAFTTVGPHVITATFTSNDPNFITSTSNSTTITVGSAPTTMTVSNTSSPTPTVNQSAVFAATFPSFTSGQATPVGGTVSFSDPLASPAVFCVATVSAPVAPSTAPVATCTGQPDVFLVPGTHTITATFNPGTTGFTAPTAVFSQSVTQSPVSVALTSPTVTTSSVDQNVTFAATVTQAAVPTAPAGSPAPTGSITFTYPAPSTGTPTTICTQTLPATSCTGPLLAAGTFTVTATYSGDSNYIKNTATQNQTVAKTVTSLAVTLPTGPLVVNQLAAYSAQLSLAGSIVDSGLTVPTGLVTFIDVASGTTVCSVLVAPSGLVTCPSFSLPAGTRNIAVHYAGDGNFSASDATTQTITVLPSTPTVVVTSSNPISVATQSVTFTATITPPSFSAITSSPIVPTGTVTFSFLQGTQSQGTCTTVTSGVSGSSETATCKITFASIVKGNVTVTASYSGDSNYTAATGSTTQIVQNFAPAIATSLTPFELAQGSLSVPTNSNVVDPYIPTAITSSTGTAYSGFSDTTAVTNCTVTTSVPGLTCAATGSSSNVATVTAGAATPTGTYTLQFTVTDTNVPTLSQTTTIPVTIINQAPAVIVPTIGTATATFTAPAGLSGLTCNANSLATLVPASPTNPNPLAHYTTSTGQTFASVKIQCSSQPSAPSGSTTYTFVITGGNPTTSRLGTGNDGIIAAGLGVPFLLLVGLMPASRRLRKTLLRGALAVTILGILAMNTVGCSSGGFTKSTNFATNGSYLIQIVNASGVTVAEVPIVVSD